MRVLLDESVPRRLGFALADHFVRTVQQVGLQGYANGELLRAAAKDFDVLISGDTNMSYQQNQSLLPMTVIVLQAQNNKLESFLPLVPRILGELEQGQSPRFVLISA
jgi:predicted nuclease of predicted toxin-antitoxin system